MTQPIILNIQMTVPGLELVIGALRKLPHEQVADLVSELTAQGRAEFERAQAAAAAADEKPAKGKKAKPETEQDPLA
jgi:riboflavin synthase